MSVHVESEPRWYAVQTKPRQEEVARENLERQGYWVYLPRLQLKKRRNNRWQTVIEPLFPGYLFLHIDLNNDNVAPVRSTFGVRAMVRFGHECVAVADDIIAWLQQRERREFGSEEEADLFKPGDKVQITHGPFGGLEAVYEMKRSDDRVMLLIEILGRKNQIAVALDDVTPAGT